MCHTTSVATKRRLPVLQSERPSAPTRRGSEDLPNAPPEGDEARPPWHWIGFGTVAVFAVWLPLSYVAELVRRRATEAWIGSPASPEETARAIAALSAGERARFGLVMFATHGTALALASFAGGYLVGRYGGEKIGAREASLAGLMAAIIAAVLAWSGVSWVPLVTLAVATAGAYAGGRAGVKRRI